MIENMKLSIAQLEAMDDSELCRHLNDMLEFRIYATQKLISQAEIGLVDMNASLTFLRSYKHDVDVALSSNDFRGVSREGAQRALVYRDRSVYFMGLGFPVSLYLKEKASEEVTHGDE